MDHILPRFPTIGKRGFFITHLRLRHFSRKLLNQHPIFMPQ